MSRSPLQETIALSQGEEIRNGQYMEIPVELGMKKTPEYTGTILVRAQYRASQDRVIKIPLETDEIRRLHRLTGNLLNE